MGAMYDVGSRIWTSGPLKRIRRAALRLVSRTLSSVYSIYKVHPAMWRVTATNYQPWMGSFARLHAWMTCQMSSLHVPAYRDFLRARDWRFRWWRLDTYPPTDKQNYVEAYDEEARCWHGRLSMRGTLVDESSGSSGTPFNWVRGRRELRDIHRNVAGFTSLLMRDERRLFVVNAYSMGAWATGTNTGIAMAKVAMVKNTGPDLDKIVDTLRHFGPSYTYLVTAYPPFLKDLRDRLDAEGLDWSAYRMHGLVGGEGMTEALRDYCEERFVTVRSGYGASDLTIGIGGETDLTVWLRKRLLDDRDLRDAVLGPDETRTPMVFQYNPLETYLEVDANSELLCTLTSTLVLSPKLRYNIGDEARILDWHDLNAIVQRRPDWARESAAAFRAQGMKLPLLLLYGRADSTISFMGANIYPLDVENGLYGDRDRAAQIASFTLSLDAVDGDETRQQPVVHVELRDGAQPTDAERATFAAEVGRGVIEHLARVSRDFAESLEESDRSHELEVRVHDHATGPFAAGNSKIKRVYLRTDTDRERTGSDGDGESGSEDTGSEAGA